MEEPHVIARLTSVPARQVWTHEALDFTPWLLENADVLSDVLQLDLDLEAAEHPVGGFSLDLIGRDRSTGARVIVENQLETSDHTHLGQIMTYAGGTDAAHVVWVAPRFREEHRRALEWLNERTDEETRFFAVEVKAVRIGDSPVAPLLTLVVQPNDWGKQVRTSAVQQSAKAWTPDDFQPALVERGSQLIADAVANLMRAHEELGAGASFFWGEGRLPSVTAVMAAGRLRAQPWSVYSYGAADGGPVWALNFDWIHKQGRVLSEDVVESIASELEDLPGVLEGTRVAREAGWRKRPSIPASALFAHPDAVRRINEAMRRVFVALMNAAELAPPTTSAFNWTNLHEYMAAIPRGRWTTYGDLAQLVGTAAQPLGQHITRCADCPAPHRVLSESGAVSEGFSWSDPTDERDPVKLLEAEGVQMKGNRASAEQRIRAHELAQAVGRA